MVTFFCCSGFFQWFFFHSLEEELGVLTGTQQTGVEVLESLVKSLACCY